MTQIVLQILVVDLPTIVFTLNDIADFGVILELKRSIAIIQVLVSFLLSLCMADLLSRGVLHSNLFLPFHVTPHTLQILILVLHEGRHATVLLLDCSLLVREVFYLPRLCVVETAGLGAIARKFLLLVGARLHSIG